MFIILKKDVCSFIYRKRRATTVGSTCDFLSKRRSGSSFVVQAACRRNFPSYLALGNSQRNSISPVNSSSAKDNSQFPRPRHHQPHIGHFSTSPTTNMYTMIGKWQLAMYIPAEVNKEKKERQHRDSA